VTETRTGIDRSSPDRGSVLRASGTLIAGGVVLYPSDTVYGLMCRADDPAAVARVGRLKGYSGRRPYILLVSGIGMASGIAMLDGPGVTGLLGRLWPGPVTVVLPAAPSCHEWVRSQDGTVALRQPADPLSTMILAGTGVPMVSTSANTAGGRPVLDPARIPAYLTASVDLFLDGGVLPDRGPSRIIRPGRDGIEVIREA
jgi:L-threonylcarbamoyladenylate synthase